MLVSGQRDAALYGRPEAWYLFNGVWPFWATASSAFSSVLKGLNAKSIPSVAAPGDGRPPPNSYEACRYKGVVRGGGVKMCPMRRSRAKCP